MIDFNFKLDEFDKGDWYTKKYHCARHNRKLFIDYVLKMIGKIQCMESTGSYDKSLYVATKLTDKDSNETLSRAKNTTSTIAIYFDSIPLNSSFRSSVRVTRKLGGYDDRQASRYSLSSIRKSKEYVALRQMIVFGLKLIEACEATDKDIAKLDKMIEKCK